MLRILSALSGEVLVELALEEVQVLSSIRDLKRFLVPKTNFTVFQQRLFREDQSECLDEDSLEPRSLQLVLLAYPPADAAEDKKLFTACEQDQPEELEQILRSPRDPRVVLAGKTALHVAARHGSVACIQLLVEAGAEVEPEEVYTSPLHVAARHGRAEAARLLLDLGAEKETPLHPASREGHLEVVRVLLERQALPDQADEDGLTPLHHCARSGHLDIARLLLNAGAARDPLTAGGAAPLHWAAAYGHVEVVKCLVEAGARIDKARGDDRRSPLHMAVQHGQLEVVRFLLQGGADHNNATLVEGATPLHWAAVNGHVQMAKLLLEARAELERKTKGGFSAMHMAVRTGNMALMRLLERGANDARQKRRKCSAG
ncbi:unnamed protein product [Cladocopium goreaui]|uniref:Ankyrin-1 n=1 Tax=Cladocopium goreaui TaxID=2562237 RepID=A0A9P1GTF7_9DINO|nr:unnamed protein product [Cladocopium goreaui]